MKKTNQKRVASVLSVAVLLTGTFAWQSFSQMALNESSHLTVFDYPVGGRLHDHYDGENKDVFVENYADNDEEGQYIYARIRFDEYYEYGEGAGTATSDTTGITVVRGDIAKDEANVTPLFGQVDTWDTYAFGSIAGDSAIDKSANIRTYRELVFAEAGTQLVYMPTFNKNENSLESDINGTYAGPDGDRLTDYDRYADYVVYAEGDVSEATQVEYADPDDEYGYLLEPASVHVAAKTERTIEIMSMDEWVNDKNSVPGAYWVYDDNGWAYWAQPILPQTATGPLLDAVEVVLEESDEWYYAVNVISQIATVDDWGTEPDAANDVAATGMYEGLSDEALDLLEIISAEDPNKETAE